MNLDSAMELCEQLLDECELISGKYETESRALSRKLTTIYQAMEEAGQCSDKQRSNMLSVQKLIRKYTTLYEDTVREDDWSGSDDSYDEVDLRCLDASISYERRS